MFLSRTAGPTPQLWLGVEINSPKDLKSFTLRLKPEMQEMRGLSTCCAVDQPVVDSAQLRREACAEGAGLDLNLDHDIGPNIYAFICCTVYCDIL